MFCLKNDEWGRNTDAKQTEPNRKVLFTIKVTGRRERLPFTVREKTSSVVNRGGPLSKYFHYEGNITSDVWHVFSPFP